MNPSTEQVTNMPQALRKTADALDAIAQNHLYDEGVLREALAQPNLPEEMAFFLKGYIKGHRAEMAHIRLQEVAIWLRAQ
jgi:hypothetical protein